MLNKVKKARQMPTRASVCCNGDFTVANSKCPDQSLATIMKLQNISRRNFLRSTITTGALTVVGAASIRRDLLAAEDYGAKKIPIGLQLYTIGGDMRKDAAASLAEVGQLGFKGVEFAGYPSQDAKEVRKMLDDHGLKCCGSHVGINTLKGDNFAKSV